jgi:hypothetical protein
MKTPTLEGRLRNAIENEERALRQMVANGDQLTEYAKKKLRCYDRKIAEKEKS